MIPEKPMKKAGPRPRNIFVIGCKFGIPLIQKTMAGESSGSVFEKNWNSEIRVDLYKNFKKVGDGQIQTTQGRLYTALWTGNVEVLQMEYQEPAVPLNLQKVSRKLQETRNKAGEISKGNLVFVMARDVSNKISKAKYSKVFSKLRNYVYGDPQVLTPKLAGLINWNAIAPTIEIAFFPIINLKKEGIEELVKEAVYVPTKNSKKDMFKIAAHGVIF